MLRSAALHYRESSPEIVAGNGRAEERTTPPRSEEVIMKHPARLASLIIAAITSFPAGAAVLQYSALLDGASESPPNASSGTGTALVIVDTLAKTMRVQTSFTGLDGLVTNAHIHCCTAIPGAGNIGVATQTPSFPGFPSGVTFGTYDVTFDLTQEASFNGAFVTNNGGTAVGAQNALLTGLDQGRAYFNIHTNQVPSGEIRGFLLAVPEPGSFALMLTGIGILTLLRRRETTRHERWT